jgi:ADP-heptose:LPS heptosyltransferase
MQFVNLVNKINVIYGMNAFKKVINIYRKKATRLVTSGLLDKQSVNFSNSSEVKRILITRPNHRLGNQLLITPLVKEVHNQFPEAKIDLFLKGNLGGLIFENYDYVDKIMSLPKKHFNELGRYLLVWIKLKQKKYDLVINAEASSSSGRLSTKVCRAKNKFFGFERHHNLITCQDGIHISKYPIYSLRYFLRQSLTAEVLPSLEIKLSNEEVCSGTKLLKHYADLDKPTICLYTFATDRKCFEKVWWNNFYESLSNAFPNYNIIEILPVENISALNYKIPSFYSKNIREIASFISQTSLFITGDCGMMHLAAATQTPTVGLFNVTNKDMYGPYNKDCLNIDVNLKNEFDICLSIKTHTESLLLYDLEA